MNDAIGKLLRGAALALAVVGGASMMTATPASASSDCSVRIGWDGGYFYFCLLCGDDDSCEYECTTGHSGKC